MFAEDAAFDESCFLRFRDVAGPGEEDGVAVVSMTISSEKTYQPLRFEVEVSNSVIRRVSEEGFLGGEVNCGPAKLWVGLLSKNWSKDVLRRMSSFFY